jgi:tyrosyl-tRNA synthetase
MTSPYKFYQFWLNLPDEDLPKLWRTFSLRSLEEIQAIEAEYQAQPNEQKRLLAVEMTDFVHNEEARKAAEAATHVAFHPKLQKSFLESLSVDTFELLCQELPHFELAKADLAAGLNIVELLAEKTNILSSKSEARKAIKNNAIAVNSEKVQADTLMVQADQLLHGQFLLVENGKKNKYLLRGV